VHSLPAADELTALSEYFIRLATLLWTDFPEKLPVLGYIAKNVGVRQWRETWNDNAVVISAEAETTHDRRVNDRLAAPGGCYP
jgi:hypothetical protein